MQIYHQLKLSAATNYDTMNRYFHNGTLIQNNTGSEGLVERLSHLLRSRGWRKKFRSPGNGNILITAEPEHLWQVNRPLFSLQ